MADDVFISKKAFMEKLDQKQGVPGSTIRFTEGYNDAISRVRSMLHSEKPAIVHCRDCVKRGTGLCPMYHAFPEQMDFSTDNGFCHRALKRT